MEDVKREILEKLNKANDVLKSYNKHAELVIVGGSAFILKGLLPRVTRDIDYINARQPESIIVDILEDENINSRVITFESTFGDWREDIEVLEYNFSNIKVMSISTERLLSSRVFSLRRWDDLEYIFEQKDIEIDQNKFENIIEETLMYCDPGYMREFRENIYELKEVYRKRGWDETEKFKKFCER